MKEYSIFMDTIRKYQGFGEDEPYRKAIEECIEKDVLADYLRKKGSEVVNMLMSEYNYEQDIEVQREEAYEEGKKFGREEGIFGTIKICRDFHISGDDIVKKLMENFSLTKEKAEEYMKKFHVE